MAEALPQTVGKPLSTFTAMPVPRQLGVIAGLAMAVALAVSLAIWGVQPTYQVLLPGLGERDTAEAMSVLSREGIDHRLDSTTGALMVPAKAMHEARLQLATEGLPRETTVGFELLDEPTGLGGSSRFAEAARYQRALEGELARSIMTLDSVGAARVHLALPRESVFVRERSRPGASVLLDLHPGRVLDEKRTAGIVHLVASSVPDLAPERVTVVDQGGRLLSGPGDEGAAAVTSRRLEYTRELEEALRRRVHDILSPVVGDDGLRAQVTAEVDFTQIESTREEYDPERSVVRSEQISDETRPPVEAAGVPGSLTNQPPDGASVAPPAAQPADAAAAADAAGPEDAAGGPAGAALSRSRSTTRNYEVDRTISHVRETPGAIERLSVAVVVNDRTTVDENGEAVSAPRTDEEMQYLTSLVEKAVGFDAARGDSVNVVNASFREIGSTAEAPVPETPLWREPWARDLIRQAMAGVGLLLLILLVFRPALKSLLRPPPLPAPALGPPALEAGGEEQSAARQPSDAAAVPPGTFEGRLEQARLLTQEDPRLVAQVVRQWLHDDEK